MGVETNRTLFYVKIVADIKTWNKRREDMLFENINNANPTKTSKKGVNSGATYLLSSENGAFLFHVRLMTTFSLFVCP